MKFFLSVFLMALGLGAIGQAPANWQHLDAAADGYPGISADRMYKSLLKDKKSNTIIVAVIDSGVDVEHEDLKGVMWVNEDEIPGNGIDDDKNGYIDDVHGWNFIGNAKGENVHYDNLEGTRVYAKLRTKFANVIDASKVSRKDKKDYELFKELETGIETEGQKYAETALMYGMILGSVEELEKQLGAKEITAKMIEGLVVEDEMMQNIVGMLDEQVFSKGGDYSSFKKQLLGDYDYLYGHANYYYNPDVNTREIVGDDYANSYERNYGNNDYQGPDAQHGTHVAGIIGAQRGNGIGMDGVANNVRIMTVRAVPAGDERDKDVANAIIYAVDNGASVINMSFGKSYSWDKKAVDKAIKYAAKKDVLLVHAAGNDGALTTYSNNFPNVKYEKPGLFKPKTANNWIEVGAANWEGGDKLVASFSNYNKDKVDVFAPGVDIYATIPDNGYEDLDGTSMASPVVAGLAAVLRSYYPTLTAVQVKDIILSSTSTVTQKVVHPETGKLVPFSELCKTGGIINGFNAVIQADKVKGKRKSPVPMTSVQSIP